MNVSAFLLDYALFLAKLISVAMVFVLCVMALGAVKKWRQQESDLRVTSLNEYYDNQSQQLQDVILGAKRRKKSRKKELAKDDGELGRPRIFVMDFEGDIAASAVEDLREQISAVLQVAQVDDEVLLRLESSGGLVHAYGLASSQLKRLRDRKVRLVVAVDKVAASGGYMMACLADKLIAAPFAVIGSIGVVGAVPNVHEWLKRHDINYEQYTAGQHKRTLTVFGENTEEGRQQFQYELAVTHDLFKAHIQEARPGLEVEKVATGETWYGVQALEQGLIDAVGTSDDYLLAHKSSHHLLLLESAEEQPLRDKIRTKFLGKKAGVGLLRSYLWI